MTLPVLYDNDQTCFNHHRVCGAECCKQFRVAWPRSERAYKGMIVKLPISNLSHDVKNYLELHGVTIGAVSASFVLSSFTRDKDYLVVNRVCNNLTSDLRCKAHGTPDKPLVCSSFNQQAVLDGAYATPNCAFKVSLDTQEKH